MLDTAGDWKPVSPQPQNIINSTVSIDVEVVMVFDEF